MKAPGIRPKGIKRMTPRDTRNGAVSERKPNTAMSRTERPRPPNRPATKIPMYTSCAPIENFFAAMPVDEISKTKFAGALWRVAQGEGSGLGSRIPNLEFATETSGPGNGRIPETTLAKNRYRSAIEAA